MATKKRKTMARKKTPIKTAKKTAKRKVTKRKAAKKATVRKTAARKVTKRTSAKKATARKTTKRKTTAPKRAAKKTTKRKVAKKAVKRVTKRAATKKKTATKKKVAKKKVAKKPAGKVAKKVEAKKIEAKKTGPTPPKTPALISPKNKATNQYTQSEVFDCIQEYCGFSSRKDAREFYESFTSMLHASLKNGYKVPLPSLGKLQVRGTKARMGINPATREPIRIPAKKKIAFTPNKALKEAVL